MRFALGHSRRKLSEVELNLMALSGVPMLLWAAASVAVLGVVADGQPCSSVGTSAAVTCAALYSQCTGTAGISGYVPGALEVSPERALLCYCGLEQCLEVAEYCDDGEAVLGLALRDLDARGLVQPTCDGDSVLGISEGYSLDTGLRTCSETEVTKLSLCALGYKECLASYGLTAGSYETFAVSQYLEAADCYCSFAQGCAAEIPCQAVQDQLDSKALPLPTGSTCNTLQALPIYSLQTFLDKLHSESATLTVPDVTSAIEDWKSYAAGCIEFSSDCAESLSACLVASGFGEEDEDLLAARNINATTGECYCGFVSCLSAKAATVCQPLLEATSMAVQDTLASKAFSCMAQDEAEVPLSAGNIGDEAFTLSTSFAQGMATCLLHRIMDLMCVMAALIIGST